MAKQHAFKASDVLTPELMNQLTQDSQIVAESDQTANSDSIATTKWVRAATGDTALNAASATKLKKACKIKIAKENGDSIISESNFDGSEDVTLKIPELPFIDDLRRVSFCWQREIGLNKIVAARAEVICLKKNITWDHTDITPQTNINDGIDAVQITNIQMYTFLKNLGYGVYSTLDECDDLNMIFPMNGLTLFVMDKSNISASDLIAGVYPGSSEGELHYLSVANSTVNMFDNAKIFAHVRRIV